MQRLNSNGSSPLHILLIVVIVGLIAGVGYSVFDSQKKTNTALDNAANSQSDPQKSDTQGPAKEVATDKTTTIAIPDGFQQYKSTAGDFTFNIPKDWAEVKSSMNETTVAYLSPTGSEFPGIYVWKAASDNSSCDQTDQVTSKVTVDGIQAKQFSSSSSAKTSTTCVIKNGKVYHIVHGFTDKEYLTVYAEVIKSFKFL